MKSKHKSSRLRNIFGHFSIYLIGNFIVASVPFILLPILTRVLSPSEFGEIALFQVYLTAFIALIGLSIEGSTGRKYFDSEISEAELNAFLVSAVQLIGILTIFLLLGILIIGSGAQTHLGIDERFLLMAAIAAFSTMIVRLRLTQWQVRNMSMPYVILQYISSCLSFGLSLLLVVVYLRGGAGRIEAQTVSLLAVAFFSLILFVRGGNFLRLTWRSDHIRELLRFGVPLIPHVIGTFLIFTFDRKILSDNFGLEETGTYMAAFQISLGIVFIFEAINKAYGPWLYEKLASDYKSDRVSGSNITYYAFGIISSGALVLFIIITPIVDWIVGDEFIGAGNIAKFLIVGQMINGMYTLTSNFLMFYRRTEVISIITVTSGILHLGLILVLVPVFGAIGASIIFCLTMIARFILAWFATLHLGYMSFFIKVRKY